MKKFFFTIAALALTLSACNKVEEEKINPSPAAIEYHFCIPASMEPQTRAVDFSGTDPETGDPTAVATFAAGDSVFVFNETKGVMACDAEGKPIALRLTESDITNGGKNCTLAGDLTFYKYEGDSWNAVTIDEGDSYVLLYNLTEPCPDDPIYCNFWYFEQDGTAAGVADHAVATTTLTDDGGVLKPTSTVVFANVQSMFRFRFIDENNSPINVKHLLTISKNDALAQAYVPLRGVTEYIYSCGEIPVTLTVPTTDYIYVALCFDENFTVGDELTFEAIDADGKVYTGVKAAPEGGFVNGKYYYNTSAITLTHDATLDYTMPDIIWTNPVTPIEPDYNGEYEIYHSDFDITLSGTSRRYYFFSYKSGAVRLGGLNAVDKGRFIYCDENLTVELLNGSSNTITSTSQYYTECIYAKTLKLSGNGTLTVKVKDSSNCGIRGRDNYNTTNNDNATYETSVDVSAQLAAPGYTVTRSARTDNADGTYTWTYTVAPL